MKFKIKILAGMLMAMLLLPAFAISPVYNTASGNSVGSTGAKVSTVIFPADASSTALQIRVIGIIYASDTNNGVFSFATGTGAYAPLQTNAATITNIVISATNGITIGDTLWLQKYGGGFTNAVVAAYMSNSLNTALSSTNIGLATGGFGLDVGINDQIYETGQTATLPALQGTNSWQGEALYVGNRSRPVVVTLSPGWVTNRIVTATVHYE